MKRIFLAFLFVLSAAASAGAKQPITMDEDGIRKMLGSMASGACPPETCFDGQHILRREGALVILKEEKIGERRGRWTGHANSGGRHYEPPKVIYRQTVGVADREGYLREARSEGSWIGSFLGLVGFFGFLAGPIIGLACLSISMTAGILGGGRLAERKAEKRLETSKVFDRVKAYEKR